jgi:predicted nucleic acid-binding Zn ribbon protein
MDDATTCHLCGATFPEEDGTRCSNCGLYSAVELGRAGYRRLAIGLAGVYALTALGVLLTRGS